MAKNRKLEDLTPTTTSDAPPLETSESGDATTPFTVVVLKEADESEPFTIWLRSLRDNQAKSRILARLAVVRTGSLGVTRTVGDGVSELKIDYGPGYRLYYGRKGKMLVVLIVGGDKRTQQADIERAKVL